MPRIGYDVTSLVGMCTGVGNYTRQLLAHMLDVAGDHDFLLMANRQDAVLDVALDWRALGFSAELALLTGIIFGLLPALRATRVNLTAEFHGGTRQVGDGPDSRVGRGVLLVQVALSLVLLVGAGLFMCTLENLRAVDAGFNRENLLLFRLGAESAGYSLTAAGALHALVATSSSDSPGLRAPPTRACRC